jgi:hypothetical protein
MVLPNVEENTIGEYSNAVVLASKNIEHPGFNDCVVTIILEPSNSPV